VTQQQQHPTQYSGAPPREPSTLGLGLTVFAGVMMVMAGGFQILNGLVALFNDSFYATTRDYVFKFDTTAWGWIHVLLGVVVAAAGLAILAGWLIGRIVGIALAALSAVANFAFIPYYPFWSLSIIVLDVLVIWALALHGRDIARA
jgi:hypothetical protein